MNWKRILLLAAFDLRHSIFRLKGLVFLIPCLFFWYLVLKFLWNNGEKLLTSRESMLLLSWLMESVEVAKSLLIQHPPTLSMFFIIALGVMPPFAMLSGNDQTAGDAGRLSLRFFLTRCTRAEIFAGRFISHYLLFALTTLLAGALATAISLHHDQHAPAAIMAYALETNGLLLIYMAPFCAYMAAISALMSSALSALLMSATMYVVLLVAGAYLNAHVMTGIALVPSGVKEYLFRMKPDDLLWALTGLFAYGGIYLSLGWLFFRKRNI
jgi:hypothetical protein